MPYQYGQGFENDLKSLGDLIKKEYDITDFDPSFVEKEIKKILTYNEIPLNPSTAHVSEIEKFMGDLIQNVIDDYEEYLDVTRDREDIKKHEKLLEQAKLIRKTLEKMIPSEMMLPKTLHEKIKLQHQKTNKEQNKLLTLIDSLPNIDKPCNCEDKLDMGRYDYDIDYGEGTAKIVCLSCGGDVFQ